MKEITIPLQNGCSLRCGHGVAYHYGGYLRICDSDGNEILYWDSSEWESEGEGESVIGACMASAVKPFEELTKDRKLVDGVWIFDDGLGIDYEDDGQPDEYTEWQDYFGGDDWDHGQCDDPY